MGVWSRICFIDEIFSRTGVALRLDILVVSGMHIDLAHASAIVETTDGVIVRYADGVQQLVAKAALTAWYDDIRRAYPEKFVPLSAHQLA